MNVETERLIGYLESLEGKKLVTDYFKILQNTEVKPSYTDFIIRMGIESYTFAGCRSLKSIQIPPNIDYLGGYAFRSEGFCEADGIPVLRIGNINAGFFKPVNMVFWEEDESLERYIMYPGDLVMSLTGTVGKDDYGNVCMLGNDYDKYYLNQRNAKLELKEGLDKHYLSQLLRFEKIKKRLTGISRGVRQANISNKDILGLRVPIPPIALQWQYATFVTQVDKSKLTVQQGLDKLELLKQSLMQKYFG